MYLDYVGTLRPSRSYGCGGGVGWWVAYFFNSLDWTLGLIHVLSLAFQTLKTFFYNVLVNCLLTHNKYHDTGPRLLTPALSTV